MLDTHAVIWWVTDRGKVSAKVRARIRASGRLPEVAALIDDDDQNMIGLGWNSLAISPMHAIATARLAGPHKNPFDRMLVAQSHVEGLIVATVDPQIANLGARVVW